MDLKQRGEQPPCFCAEQRESQLQLLVGEHAVLRLSSRLHLVVTGECRDVSLPQKLRRWLAVRHLLCQKNRLDWQRARVAFGV